MVRFMQKVNKPSMHARKTSWKVQGCGTNTEAVIAVSLLARGARLFEFAIQDHDVSGTNPLSGITSGRQKARPSFHTLRKMPMGR